MLLGQALLSARGFLTKPHRLLHMSAAALKDYYTILGVPKSAKEAEIKKAYYQVGLSGLNLLSILSYGPSLVGKEVPP
jgi:hypothetical protein